MKDNESETSARSDLPIDERLRLIKHGDEITSLLEIINKYEKAIALKDTQLETFKKHQDYMDMAIDGAQVGVWDHYIKTGEVIRGGKWAEMLGYLPEEIGAHEDAWLELIHPDDVEMIREEARKHEEGEVPLFRVEHRMKAKDGRWRWIMNWGKVVEWDSQGEAVRALGIHIDITERKEAEDALRKSEERFRGLADLLPQTIFELDLEGNITYLNRFGMDATVFGGEKHGNVLKITDLFIPEQRERVKREIEDGNYGRKKERYEYMIRGRDGSAFPVLIYSDPIIFDGVPVGLRGIIVDITERKRNEIELARTEKLESIGALAGGIAHDFNNILSAILGNVSLARLDLGSMPDTDSLLDEVEKATFRASSLTQQLLTFSKGGAPIVNVTSIRELISESADFILHGSKSKCVFEFPVELHPVEVDENQLSHVFNNIFINANQAMPDGGLIRVSCRNIDQDSAESLLPGRGEYIEVRIEDQGCGVDEKNISKIFDPFFTTKAEGTGLGLATAYSIIRNHNGSIRVDSIAGEGAVFMILLPASDKKIAGKMEDVVLPVRGNGKILIVDDEKGVRGMVGLYLEKLGYEVVLSADGGEGVRLYGEAFDAGNPFDLVIMDLTIPGGVGGKEGIVRLKKIDPSAKAIVYSGYSNDQVMAEYKKFGFRGRLTKPFRLPELGRIVGEVIASP